MNFSFLELMCYVGPFVIIEGFFAGSEIALISADQLKLKALGEKKGARGARLALKLKNKPERILSTTLLMTSISVMAISALVALYMIQVSPKHSELLAILTTSVLVVILGELIPKTLFHRFSSKLAPYVAHPLTFTYFLFFPITRILSFYTSKVSNIVRPIEELVTGKKRTTRDDLRSALTYGNKDTELKTTEQKMIKRILDFSDTEAKNALIPLVDVDAIDDSITVREALMQFHKYRHSKMPAYSERIDNVIGVVEVRDLFTADPSRPISDYIKTAHYVPETQALEDILDEMQNLDNRHSVVVDEHGGAVGIITLEDIFEEIVGEIVDEHDPVTTLYRTVEPNSWIVQTKMEIEAINETLKLELPQGDYETLSGFLLQQFGRIPEPRDDLFFDTSAGNIKFTIRLATDRKIESVLVELKQN